MKYISKREINEFQSIGMSSTPLISEVADIPKTRLQAVTAQIVAGLGLLGICIPFPFMLPVNGQVGGMLISQGIFDLVFALFEATEIGWDYVKSKLLNYAINLLTMGVKAILSSTKILEKAANICRNLATKLRASKRLQKLCCGIAYLLEKLA